MLVSLTELRRRITKHHRALLFAGILSCAILTMGCFGRFPLTHAVYRMNGNVGNNAGTDRTGGKVAQSVVMWVLVIVPVYHVAALGDVFIFNLVEFWTGSTVNMSHGAPAGDGTNLALAAKPE